MVKSFGFLQNPDEPCENKKCEGKVVCFLVLYVYDILLIGRAVLESNFSNSIRAFKVDTLLKLGLSLFKKG